MKLRWSAQAEADRDAIYTFIEADSIQAAIQVDERIWNAARSLQDLPEKGRPGRVSGTRESVVHHTPYILAYRFEPEAIRIVRIIHTAQRWPKNMPPL